MAEIIQFPSNHTDPPPHRPNEAVRAYIASQKSNAIISSRIPFELKRYLMARAYVSDISLSTLFLMILADYAYRESKQSLKLTA